MIRAGLAAACLALAAAFYSPLASAQERLPVLDINIEDAVRSRLERDPGDLLQNGSGFIIADGELVVTSAHVIGGCRSTRVVDPNNREIGATLLVWDGRRDVAVLRLHGRYAYGGLSLSPPNLDRNGRERSRDRVPRPVSFDVQFGLNTPSRAALVDLGGEGAWVLVRAYPAEVDPATGGIREQTYEMLRYSRTMQPGTSGAPVLNESGDVVALITALSSGLTLGTPVRDIARAVQAAGYSPFERGNTIVRDPTDFVVRMRCR